jgi:hypothetical protein
VYGIYAVSREKITGSLQIFFMDRGGGKSWKKENITESLLLDRKDLKGEC